MMMGSAINGVGSSNNHCSNGSIAKRSSRSRDSRLPDWCGCGSRPVLRWSGTDLNPGRPFFGCPNYNTIGKRWCGLFMWADKIQEEDTTRNGRVGVVIDDEEWRMKIAWKLGSLESDVRALKMGALCMTCLLLIVLCIIVGKWEMQSGILHLAKKG